MFGDEELIQIHKSRGLQVANIIVFCFVIVLFRLWYLQIYKGELYHKFSIQNRLRKEIIRSPRGMIYSRNNQLLVDNTPRLDVVITRQFLNDKENTLKRLAEILGMQVESIRKIIKKHSTEAKYRPIIIKKNLKPAEVAKIETENASLPGVSVQMFISREYVDKEIGAHALGYISEISQKKLPRFKKRDGIDYKLGDFIGQFGIEEKQDRVLRGENGFEYVEVDALGRKKKYINTDNLFKGIENEPPKPGRNLKLTLDRDLQRVAYEALGENAGSVVAIDVNSGELLTMISTPAFNPSQFSRGLTEKYWGSLRDNEDKPMGDRSIQNHFSPGSTFKTITAIAALEEGLINKSSKIRCHGSFRFGRRTYRSWKRYGTEKVDVTNALRYSCNIFFYKVATELDIDVLARYANLFGFGKKTGINLAREVSGLIPTKEWKLKTNGIPWQQGETLSCSIGQSYVLVSTLQLANAYAAIATKGKLYKPFIVKEVLDNQGNILKKTQPEILSEINLQDTTWDLIHKGLYKVANSPNGTAWWRRGLGNQMAGKTGTSQVVRAQSDEDLYAKCEEKEKRNRHHGLFVAFAPFDNPKIAVAAFIEHGCSSSVASPVVEKVINKYMKKYLPAEYEKNMIKEKAQYARFIQKRKEAQKKIEAEKAGQE